MGFIASEDSNVTSARQKDSEYLLAAAPSSKRAERSNSCGLRRVRRYLGKEL